MNRACSDLSAVYLRVDLPRRIYSVPLCDIHPIRGIRERGGVRHIVADEDRLRAADVAADELRVNALTTNVPYLKHRVNPRPGGVEKGSRTRRLLQPETRKTLLLSPSA